jgi:hypothetical protein
MQAKFIRIAILAAVALVAAVFLVATGAFLCVALYEGLKLVFTPAIAALVAAVGLLLLTWAVIAIGSSVAKAAERKARAEAEKDGSPAVKIGLEIGRLIGETAAGAVGKNPTKVLVGAVVAGFLIGAVPKLRSFLLSLLQSK